MGSPSFERLRSRCGLGIDFPTLSGGRLPRNENEDRCKPRIWPPVALSFLYSLGTYSRVHTAALRRLSLDRCLVQAVPAPRGN